MKRTDVWRPLRFPQLFLRFYLTEAGRIVVTGALLAGLLTLAIPAYHIATSFGVLLVLAAAVGTLYRPRVQVTGQLPDKMIAGKPVTVRYQLTNRSSLAIYDLSLGFATLPRSFEALDTDRFIRRLGPGESAWFDIKLQAQQRGSYPLWEPHVFTTFPFNLFRQGPRQRKIKTVLVLPDYHPLERINVEADLRYQAGGIALASQVGESPEYIGNREYQPGDSPRRIDARAWARLAAPVVKEYHEEYYCHVAVVLDTYIGQRGRAPRAGWDDLEAAVSLTAAIAASLSNEEWVIDFFAAGPDLYVFRSGRHTAPFESLLEVLACVEGCSTSPLEMISPALQEQLHQTSSVVFVLLDWDQARQQLVHAAVDAGCACRVLLVRNSPTRLSYQDTESWAGPFTWVTPQALHRGEVQKL